MTKQEKNWIKALSKEERSWFKLDAPFLEYRVKIFRLLSEAKGRGMNRDRLWSALSKASSK